MFSTLSLLSVSGGSLTRGSHRNRQDAREALDLAARGKVKCFFELKPLSAIKEYASSCMPISFTR